MSNKRESKIERIKHAPREMEFKKEKNKIKKTRIFFAKKKVSRDHLGVIPDLETAFVNLQRDGKFRKREGVSADCSPISGPAVFHGCFFLARPRGFSKAVLRASRALVTNISRDERTREKKISKNHLYPLARLVSLCFVEFFFSGTRRR